MFHRDHGLILSCDVSTLDQFKKLVNISCDQDMVVGYKVGFTLVLRYGLNEVSDWLVHYTNKPLIYDHQKGGTDIPAMGKPFMEACQFAGASGVILFPLTGPDTLDVWVKAAFEQGLTPIVGGKMTHDMFLTPQGWVDDCAPEQIYWNALRLGVKNFVLPGNRPNYIEWARDHVFPKKIQTSEVLSFLMPGIGTQGGTIGNVFTACGKHRSYGIVGSDIYKAEAPAKQLNWYLDDIKRWEDIFYGRGIDPVEDIQ